MERGPNQHYTSLEEGAAKLRADGAVAISEDLGFWGAVGSLLVSMVGAGFVAFPYAFALCGDIVAPLGLLVITLFAHEAYCSLYLCSKATGFSSYDGLLSTLPTVWGRCANVSLLLLLILTATAYVLIAADNLKIVASSYFEATEAALFAIILTMIYPLCLTRSLGGLTLVINFGFVCVLAVSLIVIWQSVSLRAEVMVVAPTVHATSVSSTLTSLPIIATSVFGHMNFPRIYAELCPDVKPRAAEVSVVACSLAFLLYLTVGIAGYAAFGSGALADVIAQLSTRVEGGAMTVAQAFMFIFVICKTPLIIYPLRSQVLGIIKPSESLDNIGAALNAGLAASLLLTIYATALLIPDLGTVMDVLGALCAVPLTFIIPARLSSSIGTSTPLWRSYTLGITGVLISILSLTALFVIGKQR